MAKLGVLLLLASASVAAQTDPVTFAEGFSVGDGDPATGITFRAHTASSLMAFLSKGALLARLEVTPSEIHLAAGEGYDLRQIRVEALSPRGRIVEGVPLTFDYEGAEGLIDFEEFRVNGESVTAAAAGEARIWVTALPPSASGDTLRQSIQIIVAP